MIGLLPLCFFKISVYLCEASVISVTVLKNVSQRVTEEAQRFTERLKSVWLSMRFRHIFCTI
jgi:hypothetical protein